MLERIDGPADLKGLTIDQLYELAKEIREVLVGRVTENGGHLSSNLGVVELTLALHYVFDSPKDAIIWDVGHQAYVHKLLTGRRDQFETIRKLGGLSGFCSREESPHDHFGAGHASTSVSAGLGLATARSLRGEASHVVSVIGDGSMGSGLAFEGVNNAGHYRGPFIVVLNDNEMSIARNVGALSLHLARLRTNEHYAAVKGVAEGAIVRMPLGHQVLRALRRFRYAARALFMPKAIWEDLGFTYVGPLDGHDVHQLIDVFNRVKGMQRPVFVHVATIKGKGYGPAEAEPTALHGLSPKGGPKPGGSPNGKVKSAPQPPSYTQVFGDTLVELAKADPRIVAITAAMPDGTGLSRFAKELPSRFYDVGIAEGHAVTFASGLAAAGARPVVAIYSTFMQRAYDSIAHDLCIQKLPVVLALDRAGLVGEDGRTHHGVFDIAFLRSLPDIVVMAPRDEAQLRLMLKTAILHNGPIAIRYPRGSGIGVPLGGPISELAPLPIGQAEMLLDDGMVDGGIDRESECAERGELDLAFVSIGGITGPTLEAARRLQAKGVRLALLDARFVKPLDREAILGLADRTHRLVTVEEGVLQGGFGSAVVELLSDSLPGKMPSVKRIGLPDQFVEHGSQAQLRALYGLDAEGIVRSVEAAFPELSLSSLLPISAS